MGKLSHTDKEGNAQMVDIGNKPDQERRAVAVGKIIMAPATLKLIVDNNIKKGDVLTVAKIAGIQAAKKTFDLIPLCHPLSINNISINTDFVENGIKVAATVSCTGKTGVEMEAITAVSISLITIYDMCKAVDKNMVIEKIHLVEKEKK